MGLPDLIEIVPLREPVEVRLTVPGSKSITNRALVLAALAEGKVTLQGALWSEDTQVMVEALRRLGFSVEVELDPQESCNRLLRVQGQGGRIPNAGSTEAPLDLFVGNAGTAARFLSALVCLGHGVYRLHGVDRMHQRPQAALFAALRQLGYAVDSPNDHLPVLIGGQGPRQGVCEVSIQESSQFASALLLASQKGGWKITVVGANADEAPYVEMTRRLLESFPSAGGICQIEPDASSGSYGWAAGHLLGHSITVRHWPGSGLQMDEAFPRYLPLPMQVSREKDLGDSIMTAVVLAPFAAGPRRFTDLGRLRVQECERVQALRTELTRCGARVVEEADTLTVQPGPLQGATIETYQDHRMAMCFGILGLKVPGIRLKNPSCVKKTFPSFFQKLATPPPAGLGAVILDCQSGRPLAPEELMAV